MAHVTLEGNSIVVKCDDGKIIRPDPKIIARLDQLGMLVGEAIDQATYNADNKHVEEVGALTKRVAAETAIIHGLLTPVQKKEAAAEPRKTSVPQAQKRITAPAAAPAHTTAATGQGVYMKWPEWLETKMTEATSDDLKATVVTEVYRNKNDMDKKLGAQFPENISAATRIVFAELSKIPSFTLNLNAMAQNNETGYQAFTLLNDYLKVNKDLAGASPNVMAAANVYIRYFLLDLQAQTDQNYMQELVQLPKCKEAMDKLQKSPADLNPFAGHMGSETVIAAALYIRRWNLEQKGAKPEQIPLWQSPETMAAAKQAPVVTAPTITRDATRQTAKDTTLDRSRYEMKW